MVCAGRFAVVVGLGLVFGEGSHRSLRKGAAGKQKTRTPKKSGPSLGGATMARPAAATAEPEIRRRGGNLSAVIDPLRWQLAYVAEPEDPGIPGDAWPGPRARLIELDAARRAVMASTSLRDMVPCVTGRVVNPLCDSLQGGACARHGELARKAGLTNSRLALFYRHEADCKPLKENGCGKIFGGSLGNTLGHYFIARTAARMGGMDFVFLRHLHACPNEPYAWLPAVVATTAGPARSARDACAHGFTAACRGNAHFTHLSPAWIPAARQGGLDIRRATLAWGEAAGFPTLAAPLDDVAIHVRCGDTLAQAHAQYGLLHFGALARFVPLDTPIRVGILSEPYRSYCEEGEAAAAAGLAETRTGHSAAKCPCPCAALVESLVASLRRYRPLATVAIHDNELVMASWYRLAHAPVASLCIASTFCLWPVLGADHGYLVQGPLFPHADELADKIPGLGVVKAPGLATYKTLGGGDKRPRCGTSVAQARAAADKRLGAAHPAPNATASVTVRGSALPPAAGRWPALPPRY